MRPKQNTFGRLVAGARKKKGLTLRQLGLLVSLPPSSISEIENGRRRPPRKIQTIKGLSVVLGIGVSSLVAAAIDDLAINYFVKTARSYLPHSRINNKKLTEAAMFWWSAVK